MVSDLLIDTHIFLWLMNGNENLKKEELKIIREVCKSHLLFVSAISIWEIGMLQSKERISFNQPVHQWVAAATSLPYLKVIPIDEVIALESSALPGKFHGDPADRMIVATARILTIPLMTRDRKIIDYGQFVEIL